MLGLLNLTASNVGYHIDCQALANSKTSTIHKRNQIWQKPYI